MKNLVRSAILLIAIACPLATIHAQISQWNSVGIGGGGALFATSISPHDANSVYISCDMSEVFHSADFGQSWSQADFRQLAGGNYVGRIAFTSDPNIMYTIRKEGDYGYAVKTTDGGATWTRLSGDPAGGEAYYLYADPNNTQRLFMTDYTTMWFSVDGGTSFQKKYQASSSDGCYIGGAFFDGNNVYISTNLGMLNSTDAGSTFALWTGQDVSPAKNGRSMVSFAGAKQGNTVRFFCVALGSGDVYPGITGADYGGYTAIYSMDVGAGGWTQKTSGIASSDHPFFVAMAQNNINVAYVAGGSDNSAPIVYKTTDGGGSWTGMFKTSGNQNIATGWSGQGGDRAWSYGEYALGFNVAPNDPNHVVITDLGFAHGTTDGGATWKQMYVSQGTQNAAGASTPQGKSYRGIGLENTTSWQVAWSDSLTVFGCFADIKGIRSTDAGNTWQHVYNNLSTNAVYYIAKHPSNNTLYGAISSVHDMYQSTYLTDARIDGGKGGIITSADNGKTWSVLHDFQHPVIWLAIDPQNPNRMYASVIHFTQGGIFVTNNLNAGSGSTWTKLTNPPRTEGHPYNIRILNDGSLLCTYSGRRTTNFTASSGVFLSTDGGTTWLDRSATQMRYWTKDVVVAPDDATQNTWYCGVWSGYGGAANSLGGLYKTVDRGQNWTLVLQLPSRAVNNDRVSSCAINPANPNEAYVTTETDGLWHTTNLKAGTPNFTQVAEYPFRQPERVFWNPYKSGEVWVTSFGNGLRVGTTGITPPQPPAAPVLISPANTSTGIAIAGNLQWNASATATSYHVQLSTSANFSTTVIDQSNVTQLTNAYSGLTANTVYYWRVQASNTGGPSSWSEVWSFTTAQGLQAPIAPTLVAPANNSINAALSGTLEWNSVPTATEYHVQLSASANFSTTIIDLANLTPTSIPYSGLQANIRYYWRVQASNAAGPSPWSEVWNFTKFTLGVEEDENCLPDKLDLR